MDSASLSLGLTPHGRLALIPDDDAPPLGPGFRERLQQRSTADRATDFYYWERMKLEPPSRRSFPTGANSGLAT
jgi:hypothetical protein